MEVEMLRVEGGACLAVFAGGQRQSEKPYFDVPEYVQEFLGEVCGGVCAGRWRIPQGICRSVSDLESLIEVYSEARDDGCDPPEAAVAAIVAINAAKEARRNAIRALHGRGELRIDTRALESSALVALGRA